MNKQPCKKCGNEKAELYVPYGWVCNKCLNNAVEAKMNLDELFNKIECEFDMQQACGCPKWCNCWEDFKKYIKCSKSEGDKK